MKGKKTLIALAQDFDVHPNQITAHVGSGCFWSAPAL
jgi:hypothetical protein